MSIEMPQVEVQNGILQETTTVARRQLGTLPDSKAALAAWRAQIASEQHKDTKVDVSQLRMGDDGALHIVDTTTGVIQGIAHVTHGSLTDLSGHFDFPRGAVATLEGLSPYARAVAVNDLLQSFKAHNKGEHKVVIRGMTRNNKRFVRGIVSGKHSVETGDDLALAAAVERTLGSSTALMRVVRSLERTDFEVQFPNIKTDATQKGDVVEYRLRGTNSEIRKASLEVFGGLFRLICLNGMVREAEGTNVTIRHTGNLTGRLQASVHAALIGAEDYFNQWRGVQTLSLPEGSTADLLASLEKKYADDVPASLWEKLPVLWNVDGQGAARSNSVAALVNAATRAAQDYSYAESLDIERLAGKWVSAPHNIL